MTERIFNPFPWLQSPFPGKESKGLKPQTQNQKHQQHFLISFFNKKNTFCPPLYSYLVTQTGQRSLNLNNGLKTFLIVRHTGHLLIHINQRIPSNTKIPFCFFLVLFTYLNREDLYSNIFTHQLGFPNATKTPPGFDFQQLQWFESY